MAKKKKRMPIEQLRAAGKLAREMLVKKGIIAKDSVIDQLIRDEKAPKLPGIPAYLPHQWTLKAAQRIMYDLLIIWKGKCKGNDLKANNITEFFKFVVKELQKEEDKYKKEMDNMPELIKSMENVLLLKDVFSPLRKKETMHAIQRFFIDSFAVAIVLKNNHTTADYANWFLDWTQDLYALWIRPEKHDEIKRV